MILKNKSIINFIIIIALTFISVQWTFFIFKKTFLWEVFIFIILSRCLSSFLILRDYSASWSKSTPRTFIRKIIVITIPFIFYSIYFYGYIQFSLLFSECMFYCVLINFSIFTYYSLVNKIQLTKNKNVVIYGAGKAGSRLKEEFISTDYKLKYFIDDDKNLHFRSIEGIKIISKNKFLKKSKYKKYDLLIIAMLGAETEKIKLIYEDLRNHFNEIKIIPKIDEILQDQSFTSQLKSVSLYDLLARNKKSLDKKIVKDFIFNKTILVTGAGGSIGSEIVRQCIKYKANKIILLDHSEYNLYKISEELRNKNISFIEKMGSVVDKEFLNNIFSNNDIDIVFHAAAYKHVPLVENNISQAIINNVIGTKNTIDIAIKYNVQSFVLVSTDKAVRPTNVMGATKRVCELYAQNVDCKNTKISAVRFGNVLGSSGSVIPKFEEQVKNGGPLTVTHEDITRYFMLIPEACELVLQSGAIAKNSEVFVLDMGEPVKILDLAKQYLKLSNQQNIDIKIIGLRPGEKLYEELLIDKDDIKTEYKDIFIGKKTNYNIAKLNKDIKILINSKISQLETLKKIVPEFEHKLNIDD